MFDWIVQYASWTVYPLFILGFVLLIKGADWLVDGASAIAKSFKISDLVIGLTIVSFGTSAPELVVNLVASFQNSPDIAIGNIVGSNIANVLLILGIAAAIQPLQVRSNTVWKEVPMSFLAPVVLCLLVNDRLLAGFPGSLLSLSDGLVLIAFFIVFLYYTFGMAMRGEGFEEEEVAAMPRSRAAMLTIAGLVALPIGGEWIVGGAVHTARQFQISESVISLTIIAIGTSLPEVAASVAAALKGKADIAVGNAVGSNIFNVFWVLGLSSVIRPIAFNVGNNPDILIAAGASLLLFIFLLVGRFRLLERWQGVVFLILYATYLVYLVAVPRTAGGV